MTTHIDYSEDDLKAERHLKESKIRYNSFSEEFHKLRCYDAISNRVYECLIRGDDPCKHIEILCYMNKEAMDKLIELEQLRPINNVFSVKKEDIKSLTFKQKLKILFKL